MIIRAVRFHLVLDSLLIVGICVLVGALRNHTLALAMIGSILALINIGAWVFVWAFRRQKMESAGFHW